MQVSKNIAIFGVIAPPPPIRSSLLLLLKMGGETADHELFVTSVEHAQNQ